MAKAGPSTAVDKSQPPPKSRSEIGSDSDASNDSPDSEDDIENVTPKRKEGLSATSGKSSTVQGKSLPKYAPPRGMIQTSIDATFKDSPFEYDRLASNPKLQLWTIRVPADFKPSRLASLKFTPPSGSRQVTGSLSHKSTTYKLLPAGHPRPAEAVVNELGRQPTAGPAAADSMALADPTMREDGGDEMGNSMKLLVPSVKQNGALITAPLPISQQLLLTPQMAQSASAGADGPLPSYLSETIPGSSSITVPDVTASTAKRPQPSHLFKFRNRAFGFDTPGPSGTRTQRTGLDIEQQEPAVEPSSPVKEKKKKRKSEGLEATPKKKKAKV